MVRRNGKSDVDSPELDADHELPPAEDTDTPEDAKSASVSPQPVREGEFDKLKAERDALLDRLARLQAEFENARKRAAREQQEFREYALADAVKELLPTLDSFERALQTSARDKTEFRGGVELIYKQLQDALVKLGLRPIPAKGEPFDPHLHQAIEMVDTGEAEDHQVLDELQRGYKLKDRLLRPSMVRVARNPGR
ncbi:MAG TPA: nucleotide exchange factor GrpE [Terriglobales bacterium]|nr:nucleotide exchange factor GrpE [Terriglobales bacterium]